ncbi:hypothetical protein F8388_014977 [Cannabis sativa]|uniref:Pectinesterase inhibitor domain-containing protein n=1 Tax=Cannabis sativa TaxID=3483 RepID=A0A7J6DWS4_CANSA|nr:hypothetical protein F8388_014977 [Cannabis sativa]
MSGKAKIGEGLVSVNTFTVRLVIINVVIAATLQISNGHLPFGGLGVGFGGHMNTNAGFHAKIPSFPGAAHHAATTFAGISHAANIFCGTCEYRDACIKSIASMGNKANANPIDYFQAAIQSTISQVSAIVNVSASIAGSSSGSKKMYMEDCQELLGFAVDELQTSFSTMGGTDLSAFYNKQEMMSNGLSAANQLARNALAIVSTMVHNLSGFKINFKFGTSGNSRALTGFAQVLVLVVQGQVGNVDTSSVGGGSVDTSVGAGGGSGNGEGGGSGSGSGFGGRYG